MKMRSPCMSMLFGLRNREVDRIVPVLVRIGPDEALLFKTVGGIFLDDPGGLILAVYFVWCWPDAIAIVFDNRGYSSS